MTATPELKPHELPTPQLPQKERMTQETAAERLERVSAAAYRIRHHALNMGEVQG
jgi:transketolase